MTPGLPSQEVMVLVSKVERTGSYVAKRKGSKPLSDTVLF